MSVVRSRVLIVDVGLHHGQDTAYYLSRGAAVIAIDADRRLIEEARDIFADAVAAQRLHLIHAAVASSSGTIPFHLSDNSEWNSLSSDIATRQRLGMTTVDVQAVTLPEVFRAHGTPDYCKIDVEGADLLCLESLQGYAPLPRYISVESECGGDQGLTETAALQTLHALHGLGYERFKLVDQATLAVLSPNARFYTSSIWKRAMRKLRRPRDVLERRLGWRFERGASGPFGDELAGDWVTYPVAVSLLRSHRADYFRLPSASPFGFWCDWHAAR